MSRKFDFYKVKSRDFHEIFMKSSKHVETCFVRANNDFDDKLTAFCLIIKFWTKISKNGHCVLRFKASGGPEKGATIVVLTPIES